jgi:hypothetical protein
LARISSAMSRFAICRLENQRPVREKAVWRRHNSVPPRRVRPIRGCRPAAQAVPRACRPAREAGQPSNFRLDRVP